MDPIVIRSAGERVTLHADGRVLAEYYSRAAKRSRGTGWMPWMPQQPPADARLRLAASAVRKALWPQLPPLAWES
jgi:hypothetical protein